MSFLPNTPAEIVAAFRDAAAKQSAATLAYNRALELADVSVDGCLADMFQLGGTRTYSDLTPVEAKIIDGFRADEADAEADAQLVYNRYACWTVYDEGDALTEVVGDEAWTARITSALAAYNAHLAKGGICPVDMAWYLDPARR